MAQLPLTPPHSNEGPETAQADKRAGAGNLPVLTVSELSFALKRTVEESFGRVRVRGEQELSVPIRLR